MKILNKNPLSGISKIPTILFCMAIISGCEDQSVKTPEALSAKIFEPGNFSTETGAEYGVTFSPDGQFIYFTRGNGIFWAHRDSNGWSPPQIAEFSKGGWISDYLLEGVEVEYFNWDPVISPDGSKLYIMSHGLFEGKIIGGEDKGMDLWVLERTGEGFGDKAWGKPENLGPAINSPVHNEGAIGISGDGTAYFFSSDREEGFGAGDIYYSNYVNGEYLPAENIGSPINTSGWEGHTFVEPSGKFLLYISNNNPDGFGSCDIYVSHRTETGWGGPINLGPGVNTETCEITPTLSPDGKILYFGRIEGSDIGADVRNIYSIPLEETDF